MKPYKTIGVEACAEFTEKRSRFIGAVKPVETPKEAETFICSVRAEHFAAKHNVFAYNTLNGGQRCSDDGEPQGTGGVPVLNVIMRSGINNVAVVVTRYFGGILLGTGGLIRAYSRAASDAIEKAGTVIMEPCCFAQTKCTYSDYKTVSKLIAESGALVDNTVYTDKVDIKFHIKAEKFSDFQNILTDITRGKCSADVLKKDFCPQK